MRRTAARWVFVVALFLAPEGAAGGSLRLTMDEAVARAQAANLELQASRKDVDVANANLRRSKAWLPANPYLSSGAQRTTQQAVGPNYAFLLSQEFEVAGQRGKRIDAAQQGVEKAAWEVKGAEQNLTASVKTAFVQALVSSERVTLAHRVIDAAVGLGRQLEAHKEASHAQRMDLNVALVQETRARRDLAGAEQTRETALATLRRLLMLPLDQEIELAGTLQHDVRELPPGPEFVERALHQRPDLTALRHGVQRADSQLALLRREAIPNITLSASVSRFEGDTAAGGDVGMPIPFFHRKSADIDEAIAERDRASLQLGNLERTLAQEVLDARRACSLTGADLQSLQNDIVPRLEENLRLETRLYERGEVTVSELIGVHIDAFGAHRERLDALQTYNEALIELERVTGGSLDTARNSSPPTEEGSAVTPRQ